MAALATMAPFFTGNIIGGVDARWYAYMLADAIEQARLGHTLITVGEGPFAWNGSVHLFRSAPVYMAVARAWDVLTLRHLNAFALQHLTVITSAVAGTVGFYAAAVRILPNRRWTATGLALLYLATPAWLATVVYLEAYMSYMAFGALPLVLYGNARTVLRDDGRGYIILGTGLALVWMCHPLIAFNATVVTLVIQCGLFMGRGIVSWKHFVAGILTFVVLGAYYFTSMSELPPAVRSHSAVHYLVQIAGFSLFFIGIGRFALIRKFGWALCAAGGAFAVWMTDHPWFCWAVATAGVWIVCVGVVWATGRIDFKRHAFVMLFLSTLAGAAIAEAWVGRSGIYEAALNMLALNTAQVAEMFKPLTIPRNEFQVFQPGWALLAAFAVAIGALFGSRPLGAKLFFATLLGLAACFLRFPLVSNFLIGRFPVDFVAMCGDPLALRMMPVIASFTAMAAVIWMAALRLESRSSRVITGSILGALVLWSGCQTIPFFVHSRDMTGNAHATENSLRPENAMLDAYAYLLLPLPPYFSHGKTDPMIESRLLDRSGRVVSGPKEDALAMESRGVRKIRMTTAPLANSTTWFEAGPPLTVNPGEHLLLRFEFDPGWNYSGYFILKAEHSYREYHLPNSGMASAFGVGGSRMAVLSLWNTGSTPENYAFSVSGEPGNDVPHSGGFFANLYVSTLDSSALPVSLKSFFPYRAQVTSADGGTLETFRVYIPGYRATVDGHDTPVTDSKGYLASVVVPPGSHDVELRFVGTARLWLAAAVSAIGWACLIAYCGFVRLFRQDRSALLPSR